MSRQMNIGGVIIGGGADIAIQSMCNTATEDVAATVAQILRLEQAGCEIIRVAVPTMEAARAVGQIKKAIHIPLVADIHFDYKLALLCIDGGVDKIRINPGNIGSKERVRAVADGCRERGIPIRVGVNGGSLEKDILRKYGGVTAEALAESALAHRPPCSPARGNTSRRCIYPRTRSPPAGAHAPARSPPALRGGGHPF